MNSWMEQKKGLEEIMNSCDFSWSEPKGVDKDRHAEYLEEFNQFFFDRVRSMIDQNIANQPKRA